MTAPSETVLHVPPGWKQMASGRGVDLAHPSAAAVDFGDIATALSLTCRFNGGMRDQSTFYSVAQHSLLVAMLLPDHLQVYGLLHDAHEAYLGDDSTPKKNLLRVVAPLAADVFDALARRWDLAIWEAARIAPPTSHDVEAIKWADRMALAVERRDLLASPGDEMTRRAWAWLPIPSATVRVFPTSPEVAHRAFTDALAGLLWGGAGGAA